MNVFDIGAELPFDAANLPWPITSPKTSVTIHWPGGEFDVDSDDDAHALLHAFAEEHIAKDWSAEIPGVQGGAGIMYEEAIAPSGTVFLLRDPNAVLWHSNDSVGNATSRPILVICGEESAHQPTPAQLRSLRARIVAHGVTRYPHGPKWTSTRCPGDALRAFIAGDMSVEEEMTDEEFRAKFLALYADVGVAQKFDQLATQIGDTIHMVERVQDGERIQETELAEAKARLDKLREI